MVEIELYLIDRKHKIEIFHFSYSEEKNQWIAEHPEYPGFLAILNKGYVLGKPSIKKTIF